ncbi:hypothetical protein AKO1_015495 [Acrasis kona]|uniref:peptidylprolyl isomerase n=1 Tax=Acrasis kona TaxID=1008807 RepID=A0AAW2ZFY4_9EUKA
MKLTHIVCLCLLATLVFCQEVDLTKDGGVLKKVVIEGKGPSPPPGSQVSVHYVGTLPNGKLFDSSRKRGERFEFSLGVGQVIKGWDIGVASMKKGETSIFTLTSDYAYGSHGAGSDIPPGATLIFEVELFGWDSDDDLWEGIDDEAEL